MGSKFLQGLLVCSVVLYVSGGLFSSDVEIDEKGYVLFCPGMGGFDNQVEQFIGTIDFAKELDRTLVLPYWIEYHLTDKDADQIPFEKYFNVEAIKAHTKAVTMDEFINDIAPTVWPKGRRTAFCFTYRGDSESCHAKEGNPYGPYWNKFKVNFEKDVKFAPLSYDMSNEDNKAQWLKTYPAKKYPVLAFTSTPGDFPILKHNVHLQEHLKWSDSIEQAADKFIASIRKDKTDKILGLHLKNGIEHLRACEHASEIKHNNFFSSAQCLGYAREFGELTQDLCYPPDHHYINQLEKTIEKVQPKVVFIISEIDDVIERFEKKHADVKFVKLSEKNPHVELAVLGKVDHAVVNCVSVASAFVKRERDVSGLPTEFWSFKKKDVLAERSEL